MVFPELSLSAYAIDDLLFQDAVLDAVETQIERLVAASENLLPVFVVGAPLRRQGRLYNCAVAIHRGRVLGVVPEDISAELPRILRAAAFHLRRGRARRIDHRRRARGAVRLGPDLRGDRVTRAFTFHIEICEDLWVPSAAERSGGGAPARRSC